MQKLPNLATSYRYLWKETNLLVVTGDIGPVMAGRELYNKRYHINQTDQEGPTGLRRMFWAAGLAAVSLADRESWGWTMTLSDSKVGYFCGVEPEGMMSGRTREVVPGHEAAALQRQKAGEPLKQSHFVPPDGDPMHAVQRYFEEAEQIRTRLAIMEPGRGVLVQSLPDGHFAEVKSLDEPYLVELVYGLAGRGELSPMGEVLLFYECRCDEKMITEMVKSFSGEREEELCGDSTELNVECPRCGREFVVRRKLDG